MVLPQKKLAQDVNKWLGLGHPSILTINTKEAEEPFSVEQQILQRFYLGHVRVKTRRGSQSRMVCLKKGTNV